MLKRDITFETLEDPPRIITKTYYFSLTAPEFAALNPDIDPDTNIEDVNVTEFIAKADDIVLSSYGVKSDDGLSFKKSDELREEFKDSLAYAALVDELFTSDSALTNFIRGVLPQRMSEGFDKAVSQVKEANPGVLSAPPVPPTS